MNELIIKYRFWINRQELFRVIYYLHFEKKIIKPLSYRQMLDTVLQKKIEVKLTAWEHSAKFIAQPYEKLLAVRLEVYLIKVLYETIQEIRVSNFKYFDEHLARLNGNLQTLLDSTGTFEQTALFDDYELLKLPG